MRVGAVIAAAGKSGGYKSYDKMKSVDGIQVLRQIDTLGSVRDACAKTGMSYSKGWSLIRSAEKELGYTVVERSPGGKHGGVASVSEAGKDILRKYELLEKDVAKYAEKRYKDIFES